MPHRSVSTQAPWQRWLVGLALSALLAAQALALLHGIVHHGGGLPQGAAQAGPPQTALVGGLLQAVGSHDDQSVVCQLFDQLAQASPLGWAGPVLPSVAPAQADAAAAQPLLPAADAPLYLARAPPVLA